MENRTIKILAIDDNQDNLVIIKALLRDLFPDIRMLMSTSGVKGLEIAASEKPDVILLDVIMPGMDGFEVCRKLKADKELCDIPVVFVTAIKGDKESRIRALESGAEAFLSKPIDETELTAQIRAMLKINTANLEKRNEQERLSALVEERTRELQKKNLLSINLLEDLRTEVEARKKTELELRISEEKFSKSFYTSPDSIIINRLDDGKIVEVNGGFKKIMGYEESEVIGKTTTELNFYLNPEERNAIIDRLKTTGQAKDIECWFATKSGMPLLGLVSAVIIDINGAKHILSTTRDITERKRAEAKIKESEQKYRTIFENVQDVFYQTDLAGFVVEMSPSISGLCEYNREELIGSKVSVLYNKPDERGLLVNAILQNGELWDYELELKTKSGETKIVSINARLIKDTEGRPSHIDGAIRDISGRKHAEEEARKIGLHYQAIIEKAPDGIVLINAEGDFKFVSPAAKKMFGYQLSEEPAGNPAQFTHPDDLQRVITELENIIQDPSYVTIIQYRYMDKNNNWRWVESTFTNLLADPNVESIVINFRDINDSKLAEAELKESEEFSRYLLQTIPFGMDIVDEKGNVMFQSDNLKKHYGEEVIGNTCWELYRDDKTQCPDCPLKNGIKVGITDVYESSGVLGGKTFEVIHTGIIHKGKEAMLEIFMDITDRKKAEQELIKARDHAEESDRLKSAFLANMSHEIRTPMNGILGFAELLKMPGLTGEQQQDYIAIIKKSGDRMLNIINNIVDISKIESGQMSKNFTETDINESLEFVYNFFGPEAKSKGIDLLITHKLPAEKAIVETDREKIYAILTNLVKNAIKFSDSGTIRIGSVLEGEFLKFYVTDKGIGIPFARQKAIFERFIQADIADKRAFQGAGLGLSISKAYAEMLGGKMWVESLEGEGSTFYFTIPYKTKQEPNATGRDVDAVEVNIKESKKLKVLVVEDDDISQRLVNLAVKKISKEILNVNSGIAAVEVCRKTPDIDLVLMDIKMPVMDGYEATKQIRQFNKDTVIIAQTAFGLSGDMEKAVAAGCNGYIAKPLNIAMLTKLIHTHFNIF